jgi:hypothetical protein
MATQNQPETEILSVRTVRRIAARYGLRISKARGPTHLNNRGEFQLIDATTNTVIEGVNYDMSLDEIFDYLTDNRHSRQDGELNAQEKI